MRHTFTTLLTTALVAAGCGIEDPLLPPTDPSAAASASEAQPADAVIGAVTSATMVRNANGISVRISGQAEAPNTLTIWGVVFNNWAACASVPCSPADVGNPDVMADVIRVAGRAVGGGPVTVVGSLREGDTSNSLFPQPSAGLIDAESAEIHFVFRLHGPMLPGQVDDQIHSVIGGCAVNQCADTGFAIFLPPA